MYWSGGLIENMMLEIKATEGKLLLITRFTV